MKTTKKAIKPILEASFPSYSGRKFNVEFVETVSIYNTNWNEGCRNDYIAVQMENGTTSVFVAQAPWMNTVEGQRVQIPENVVIACHSIYRGEDLGITFYAHPSRRNLLEAK